MAYYDWLKDIAVGQQVIIHARNGRGIGEIARLTKTMIIVKFNGGEYEDRFSRRNGQDFADVWESRSLSQATPELIAEVKAENRKKNRITFLQKVAWSTLELEQLEKVYEIVKGVKQDA